MTKMLRFDAEAARKTEAAYTTPELVAQRREVLRLLALQPGESVLDIGAGPGFLAAEMAAVLEAWEEHLADPWLPRTLGPALRDAGFEVGPPTTYVLLHTGVARGTFSA